jgi:hypothetical protein
MITLISPLHSITAAVFVATALVLAIGGVTELVAIVRSKGRWP